MRRILASLVLVSTAAVALTGCVIAPLGFTDLGFAGGYGPYDPSADEFDPAAEEEYQAENRASQLEFAEEIAVELRAAGSQLAPAEGESLEEFRHVVVGVGWEWCDRLYLDESRIGDADEHAEQAQRYGWSAEEYRVVAEAAEGEFCGY